MEKLHLLSAAPGGPEALIIVLQRAIWHVGSGAVAFWWVSADV